VEEELLRAVDGGHGAPQVEHRPYIEIREFATNGSRSTPPARPSLEASAWAPRGGAVAEVAAGFDGGRQREPVRGKALGGSEERREECEGIGVAAGAGEAGKKGVSLRERPALEAAGFGGEGRRLLACGCARSGSGSWRGWSRDRFF
jgi:hypothetical protein